MEKYTEFLNYIRICMNDPHWMFWFCCGMKLFESIKKKTNISNDPSAQKKNGRLPKSSKRSFHPKPNFFLMIFVRASFFAMNTKPFCCMVVSFASTKKTDFWIELGDKARQKASPLNVKDNYGLIKWHQSHSLFVGIQWVRITVSIQKACFCLELVKTNQCEAYETEQRKKMN